MSWAPPIISPTSSIDSPAAARIGASAPSLSAVNTSSLPGTFSSRRATASHSRPSSSRSGPKILTATSPRLPVSISATRIWMGWVNP